jgi:starch phosphorylase
MRCAAIDTLEMRKQIVLPLPIQRLKELAYNMWFSWNEDALRLFESINPVKWAEAHHNPVRLLLETADERLTALSTDADFMARYEAVLARWDEYMREHGNSWYVSEYPQLSDRRIAYFSAEFGFHECLPIYSGGLGILAGDHVKSASDLGLPLAGIGLLYKKGYFRQTIDAEGLQHAEPLAHDFERLPLQRVWQNDRELAVAVPFPGRAVELKVWRVPVGRSEVFLLDADVEGNSPDDRELTAQLYGGDKSTRIAQEILLGVGGVMSLRALGYRPELVHINEGHAAFSVIERVRELMTSGMSAETAMEAVRASTVFTTHTPVAAGHDAFQPDEVRSYLDALFAGTGLDPAPLLQLGMVAGQGLFNMTWLAMQMSAVRNGVSRLHGEVSRGMFRGVHGAIETKEVPIRHVTNGVHMDTWLAPEMKAAFDRFLPGTWRSHRDNPEQWRSVGLIPDETIWSVHMELKERLIRYVRRVLAEQSRRNGASPEHIADVRQYLQPKALTVVFARRFASYKRANLLFSDLSRLNRIVNHPERPVQFIFAGKAHPADLPAQELIRQVYKMSQHDVFRGKIVLLENYDIEMARLLVQGADVWLNNPRRPLEASGTSGQKAAMNGCLHFSVLDGWWEEGFSGDNGFAIAGNPDADWQTQEAENTESLYRILEEQIVPVYYNQGDFPHQWIGKMKRSIETLAPLFNSDRMVREYAQQAYVPALERSGRFNANRYETADRVARYKRFIADHWHHVKFVGVNDRGTGAARVPESGNNAGVRTSSGAMAGGVTAGAQAGGAKVGMAERAQTGDAVSGAAMGAATATGASPSAAGRPGAAAAQTGSSPAGTGGMKEVTATVYFGPVWHRDAVVEAVYYKEEDGRWDSVIVPMAALEQADAESASQSGQGASDGRTVTYRAELPADLLHGPHFSVRVRPVSPDFAHDFELPLITRSDS